MSVFGSLFTAVSGLSAQSQALGMISNNIANVSTVGYKRTDAAFSSLVTSESRTLLYSPGSVKATQNARISQQGILQQSNSATDIALTGNGFFVVKSSPTGMQEPLYTRAGSFSEDASGMLRNTSGFYLYGWPLDSNGAIPAGASDINSLVPVDVAFLTGLTQPTSTASMSVNLNSTETNTPYPISGNWTPDFTRGIRVYDSLGAGQDLTLNFKKMESPSAISEGAQNLEALINATPNVGGFPDPAAVFSLAVGGVTANITLDGDIAKLLSDINAVTDAYPLPGGEPLVFANLNADGELVIKARNAATVAPASPGDSITLTNVTGTPLATLGIASSTPPAAPANLLGEFDLNGPANTEGWWMVQFTSPTGVIEEGMVNFNGAGQLNIAPNNTNGQINLTLNNINWGNGSDPQTFDFNIANFSQMSGEYNVVRTEQNGAELGLRTGVSIDQDGYVTAQFSNGQSTRIYKLAVATFANVNGLNELTGNVWRESDTSGNFNLREAGQGSAGVVNSGALEGSNVDLADEFSRMIITQRAYSANTKVISTADEMTAELLRLR